jgi:hypothetical protein
MKTSNALVRIYIHSERHERSYGEVKAMVGLCKNISKTPDIWQESGGD